MTDLEFTLPMDVTAIEKCIPHRYPFLLVDRVVAFEKGKSIHGRKNISASDPILQGHFPGNPLVPGVIMVEAMAQVSAVLGKLTMADCSSCLLMEIDETRFRRMVRPGDVLDLHVTVLKQRGNFFWFKGEAKVDGEIAATANFSAKLS